MFDIALQIMLIFMISVLNLFCSAMISNQFVNLNKWFIRATLIPPIAFVVGFVLLIYSAAMIIYWTILDIWD